MIRRAAVVSINETKQENKTDGNIKNMDVEGWLFLDTSLIVTQRKSAVLHIFFKKGSDSKPAK